MDSKQPEKKVTQELQQIQSSQQNVQKKGSQNQQSQNQQISRQQQREPQPQQQQLQIQSNQNEKDQENSEIFSPLKSEKEALRKEVAELEKEGEKIIDELDENINFFNKYMPKVTSKQYLNVILIFLDMMFIQFRSFFLMYTAVLNFNIFFANTSQKFKFVFQTICYVYLCLLFLVFLILFRYIVRYKYSTLAYHMEIRDQKKQKSYYYVLIFSQVLAIVFIMIYIILRYTSSHKKRMHDNTSLFTVFTITYTFIEGAQHMKAQNQTMIGQDKIQDQFQEVYLRFHKLDIISKTSEQYFEEIYDKVLVQTMATKDNPNAMILDWKNILLDCQKDHDLVVKSIEGFINKNKSKIKMISKEK